VAAGTSAIQVLESGNRNRLRTVDGCSHQISGMSTTSIIVAAIVALLVVLMLRRRNSSHGSTSIRRRNRMFPDCCSPVTRSPRSRCIGGCNGVDLKEAKAAIERIAAQLPRRHDRDASLPPSARRGRLSSVRTRPASPTAGRSAMKTLRGSLLCVFLSVSASPALACPDRQCC
jgi:hypothetical protein